MCQYFTCVLNGLGLQVTCKNAGENHLNLSICICIWQQLLTIINITVLGTHRLYLGGSPGQESALLQSLILKSRQLHTVMGTLAELTQSKKVVRTNSLNKNNGQHLMLPLSILSRHN